MANGISSGPNLSDVVTECGTQTISNKTLVDPNVCGSLIMAQVVCTPVSPSCGDTKLYAKCCGSLFTLDTCGNETEVGTGTGGGGLDSFHTEIFECGTCCFTSGNNASFDGGGTLDGTLADETVAPISGCTSLKYTLTACSACDWVASPTIVLEKKQIGNTISILGYSTYTGCDDDVKIVIFDDTCNEIISVCSSFIKATTIPRRFSFRACVPCCATNLKWGFKTVTGNACAILRLDDVEITTAPREVKTFEVTEEYRTSDALGHGSTATKIPYYKATPDKNTIDTIGTIVNNSTDGLSFTAKKKCKVTISFTVTSTVASFQGISINAGVTTAISALAEENVLALDYGSTADGPSNAVAVIIMEAGDVIRPHTSGVGLNTQDSLHNVSIVATADSNGTVFATDYNKADLVVYAGGNSGSVLASLDRIDFTTIDDSLGLWTNVGGNGSDTFTAPENGIYTISGNVRFTGGVTIDLRLYVDNVISRSFQYVVAQSISGFNHTFPLNKGQTADVRMANPATLTSTSQWHHISITKQGLDLDNLIVENFGNIVSACGLGTGDLENVFSASVSTSSTVSKENQDFIEGNAVLTDTSLYTITFKDGFFSEAPNVVATAFVDASAAATAFVTSVSATQVTIRTGFPSASTTWNKFAYTFNLVVTRQGADYQSKANYIDNLVIENPCGEFSTVEKFLCANNTTVADMADLTFTCLVVGEKYHLTGQIYGVAKNNAGTFVRFNSEASNAGTLYGIAGLSNKATTDVDNVSSVSRYFTATSTTLYAYKTQTSTTYGAVSNSKGHTFLQVTRLPKQLGVVPGEFRPVKIGYVKDVQPTSTCGGTFTSGAWQTRELNTTSGDFAEFGTLACCQITLTAGTYHIEASSPAYNVDSHKIKLYNITDCTDDIIGTSANSNSSANVGPDRSIITDQIVISVSTTYEIQHRGSTTQAGNGLGTAAGFSVAETYTTMKITKIV